MATHRTTIVLDAESRRAARALAARWDCSMSEAIRRALTRQHQGARSISVEERVRRVEVLERLFDAFEGHDPDAEVTRLKEEDEYA